MNQQTNDEAFEKFITELDFQDIAHDTESIKQLYKRAWQAAIAYAEQQQNEASSLEHTATIER